MAKQTSKAPAPARTWTHGEMMELPIKMLEPNPWNPNEMTAEQFHMLSSNIDEAGFLDPVLVVPLPCKDGEEQRYRIIDGEHRYEQQRLMDAETIKCVIAAPDQLDEVAQRKQTVRMNQIHGKFNVKKFAALTEELMTQYQVPVEEMAQELGFVDVREFDELVAAARESLPTPQLKKEFDRRKDQLKTVDDVTSLVQQLFSKYGNTLPANFMLLDFGGKKNIWVRLDAGAFKKIQDQALLCHKEGVTFDSVLEKILTTVDMPKVINRYRGELQSAERAVEEILQ